MFRWRSSKRKEAEKMDEISNRTLAILLVGAIIISLGGTLVSLNKLGQMKTVTMTGLPTGQAIGNTNQSLGNVSLQIQDITWINFTVKRCNFGTGYVLGTVCNMNSSGHKSPTGGCSPEWNPQSGCNSDFTIKNIGNNEVYLNITWSASGVTFLGDPAGALLFRMRNGSNGSTGFSGLNPGCRKTMLPTTWAKVTAANYHNKTCANLTYATGFNAISIQVQVNFTKLASKGFKSERITAIGKSIVTS
jgi:hypothetical protein